jgi:hypothetical protein
MTTEGEDEQPPRRTVRDELNDARLVGAWYAMTHGNRLDHDHHCPVVLTRADGKTPRATTCTCGWVEAEPALERLADDAYERMEKGEGR